MQLVAASFKNLAGQIPDTGVAQHGPDLAHAAAVVADGVAVTGNQQHGQILVNSLCPCLCADVVERREHLAVGRSGKPEGAQPVGVIGFHNAFIAGKPGVGRLRVLDFPAIAAEVQLDHQRRDIARPLDAGNQPGQPLADDIHKAGACRAGNDQRRDAFRPLLGVPARVKAAHAVAVEDNGRIGKALMQDTVHRVQVVQEVATAIRLTVVAVLPCLGGVTVAEGVVARQCNAVGSVELGHRCIAAHIFAHAVAELKDSPHRLAGYSVEECGGGVLSVRRREGNGFAVEVGHDYSSPLIFFQYCAKACSFLLSPGT